MNRAVGRRDEETAETRAPRGSALERTPAQEAALHITALVSGTERIRHDRPDAAQLFSGAAALNLAQYRTSISPEHSRRGGRRNDEQPGDVLTVGVWIAAVSFCRAAWRARIERLPYRLKGGVSVIPQISLSSRSLPASRP